MQFEIPFIDLGAKGYYTNVTIAPDGFDGPNSHPLTRYANLFSFCIRPVRFSSISFGRSSAKETSKTMVPWLYI